MLVNRVHDSEITAIAAKVRTLIVRPDVDSIALLRTQVSQDFIRRDFGGDTDPFTARLQINGAGNSRRLQFGSFNSSSLKDIEREYGPDFRVQAEFLENYCSSFFNITSSDKGNRIPHIDGTYPYEGAFPSSESPFELLESGTNITMAVKGGGIVTIDSDPSEFEEEVSAAGILTKSWVAKEGVCYKDRSYAAPNAAIVITKSKGWSTNHFPIPHHSPHRQDDGNPQERVVGVGFSLASI